MLPPASNCLDTGGFRECFKYSKFGERLAGEQLIHDSRSLILGDALLLGGVPVPYGDRSVLEGVVVLPRFPSIFEISLYAFRGDIAFRGVIWA